MPVVSPPSNSFFIQIRVSIFFCYISPIPITNQYEHLNLAFEVLNMIFTEIKIKVWTGNEMVDSYSFRCNGIKSATNQIYTEKPLKYSSLKETWETLFILFVAHVPPGSSWNTVGINEYMLIKWMNNFIIIFHE